MAGLKHIPGKGKTSLLGKKGFVELVSIGPPLIGASYVAYRTFSTDPVGGLLLGFGVIWLFGSSTIKVINAQIQDKEAASKRDHEGLVGTLHVVQAVAGKLCSIAEDEVASCIRVTFHRVVPPNEKADDLNKAEEIEQLVPYVGGSGISGVGRRFSVRSGITGAAIRNKSPYVASRVNEDEDAYIQELKETWSYTDHDARSLTRGRYSALAVPILSGQHALGVVYLDSDRRNLFTSTEALEAIVIACSGINRYVDERYAK